MFSILHVCSSLLACREKNGEDAEIFSLIPSMGLIASVPLSSVHSAH